jgi:hypothetical protein
VKIATHNPMDWWFDQLVLRGVGTVATSLEGTHRDPTPWNWLMMWVTLLGPDLGEVVAYRSILNGVRNLILEFMTLRNDVTATNPASLDTRHAENHQHVDAFVGLFAAILGQFQMMLIPRDDYCYPFKSGEHFAKTVIFWEVLVGFPFGLMAGMLGNLFAVKVIAGAPGVGPLELTMLKAGLSQVNPATFWAGLYSAKEGNTADGSYNPSGDDFEGYPTAANSPYLLPYPKGQSCYVGQANLGLWSHNLVAGNMVYAYDFSLDEDDPILASRPGTVVDFFDWVPDDTDPDNDVPMPSGTTRADGQTGSAQWNFVLIRHDVDNDGNPVGPDAVHDKGPGGTVSVTYGVYGHGRKDSVRRAFAEKLGIDFAAISPANIVNKAAPVTVKRGEKIMLCGDTGTSFHNHLHMEVRVEKGPNTSKVRGMDDNSDFTIPFVFKEVSRFLDTDGVCTRFNFYTSENG